MKQQLSIYFIHYPNLAIRKQICEKLAEKLVDKFDLNVKYVLDQNPDAINMETIKGLVKLEKEKTNDIFDHLLRNIHVKQLSNTLKHLKAYEEIEKSNDEFSLIIEDDSIYADDVCNKLSALIDNIKTFDKEWHILYTGMPQPSGTSIDKNITNVKDIFKIVPVCDSYFVNKKNVSSLIEKFKPIKFCTNIQLSYIMTHCDVNQYMCVPNIFADGSKYGVFLSALETNNKLFLNPEFNKLAMIVSKKETDEGDRLLVDNLIKNCQFANHPDFMYQIALYEIKNKNYTKARQIFDIIYDIYIKNDSIVNNESEFLYNYCNLFVHSQ
jgi:hypothetical protein